VTTGRQGQPDRIGRFVAWLAAFAEALESANLSALDRLFALEASLRPDPFQPVVRGRRLIRSHLSAMLERRGQVAVSARALGVGSTYAVAHWVVGWTADGRDLVDDAILLAAFDPLGRCTSVRMWTVEGERSAAEA
jgi:hypothetical protein